MGRITQNFECLLKNDPFEQKNLINEKGVEGLITELHNKLKEQQLEALGL